MPIKWSQFSSVILINSSEINLISHQYWVRVCDVFAFCQMLSTTNEQLIYNENTITIDKMSESFNRYISLGEPIRALSLLMVPLINQTIIDKNFIHQLIVNHSNEMTAQKIRNSGDLTLICNAFGLIIRQTNNFHIKNNILEKLKYLFSNTKYTIDLQTLDSLYTNIINYYNFEDKVYNQFNNSYGYFTEVDEKRKFNYLLNIRLLLQNIISLSAKQIPIGKSIKLGTTLEYPKAVTLITHQKRLYEIKLKTKSNEWKNITAFVKFNQRNIFNYINKITNITENIIYNSIVYAITLFPDESPYDFDSKVHKLSPVVEISVNSPISGEKLENRLNNKLINEYKYDFIALLKVTLTGNKTFGGSQYTTKCHYFDEHTNKWDTEGVTNSGISGPNGGCFSTHLSAFIILRVIQHINTEYIFGVLVAVVIGILVFTIMLVFFVQKKQQI